MSNGHAVIGGYFLVAYVLPMAANLAFAEEIVPTYKVYPLTVECILAVGAVYLLFLLLSATRVPLAPAIDTGLAHPLIESLGRVYARWRIAIALVALPVGLMSFLAGQTSYRYSDEAISEADLVSRSLLLIVILLNVVITVDFVYRMFVSREAATRMGGKRFVENVLLALALVVMANGTISLFLALIALLWSLRPAILDQLLFTPMQRGRRNEWIVASGSAMVFLVVLVVAWYYGTLIKISSSRGVGTLLLDWDLMTVLSGGSSEASITSVLYYFVERYSIFYYSLVFTVAAPAAERSYDAVSALVFPLQALWFRVDYLLGGLLQMVKPEVGSIAQLNYQLLTAGVIRSREGSAPGLIASFNYVFAFPLNLLCCAAYLRWLGNRIEDLLRQQRGRRLSPFGVLLLMTFLQAFFQSPFDFLTVIDDAAIYVGLVSGVALAQRGPRLRTAPVPLSLLETTGGETG